MALENMLLAAIDLGLVTHPMAAVCEDKLRELAYTNAWGEPF
jgi:hypothetical protein